LTPTDPPRCDAAEALMAGAEAGTLTRQTPMLHAEDAMRAESASGRYLVFSRDAR